MECFEGEKSIDIKRQVNDRFYCLKRTQKEQKPLKHKSVTVEMQYVDEPLRNFKGTMLRRRWNMNGTSVILLVMFMILIFFTIEKITLITEEAGKFLKLIKIQESYTGVSISQSLTYMNHYIELRLKCLETPYCKF